MVNIYFSGTTLSLMKFSVFIYDFEVVDKEFKMYLATKFFFFCNNKNITNTATTISLELQKIYASKHRFTLLSTTDNKKRNKSMLQRVQSILVSFFQYYNLFK